MSIVSPPFLLDFASARLDEPPDFPYEVMEQWHEQLHEQFGTRYDEIIGVLNVLADKAGLHLLDVNPNNIKSD